MPHCDPFIPKLQATRSFRPQRNKTPVLSLERIARGAVYQATFLLFVLVPDSRTRGANCSIPVSIRSIDPNLSSAPKLMVVLMMRQESESLSWTVALKISPYGVGCCCTLLSKPHIGMPDAFRLVCSPRARSKLCSIGSESFQADYFRHLMTSL